MMMSFEEWGPAILLGILPSLAACNLFTEPDCAETCALSTRVEGQVLDASSTPVPGSRVRIRPLFAGMADEACVDMPIHEADDFAVFTETAGAGEFSANVEARSVDRPSCVEIRAEPPEGSSLMAATDTIRASWVLPGRAVPAYYVLVVLHPE